MVFGVLSSFVYLILALMTLALLFLMTSSIHFVTYWNINVLITAPSAVLLYLHIKYFFRKESARKSIKTFAKTALIATLIALVIKAILSTILIQETLPYFILMILLYMAEIKDVKNRKAL